jgi:hypothetical protein
MKASNGLDCSNQVSRSFYLLTASSISRALMLLIAIVAVQGCSGGGGSDSPASAPAVTFENSCLDRNVTRARIKNNSYPVVLLMDVNGAILGGFSAQPGGGVSDWFEYAAGAATPLQISARRADNQSIVGSFLDAKPAACDSFTYGF